MTLQRVRAALVGPLAVAVLMTACGHAAGSQPVGTSGHAGAATPPAAGPSLVDESSIARTIHSGTPTVLLFMATGCSSCAAQASALALAVSGHEGVRLVGVDLSSADAPSDLRGFLVDAQLDSLPFTWTIDRDGSLAARYGVKALDVTIGLAGRSVRFANQSAADADLLRQQIAALG